VSKYSKKSKKKSKKGKRVIKKTIILLCEGEKTEDSYFKALKQDGRKQNVQIESGYSDPAQLVEYAKSMIKHNEGQYDKIYCIFDRDEHVHFEKAIAEIRKFNKSSKYQVQLVKIISNPCFRRDILIAKALEGDLSLVVVKSLEKNHSSSTMHSEFGGGWAGSELLIGGVSPGIRG